MRLKCSFLNGNLQKSSKSIHPFLPRNLGTTFMDYIHVHTSTGLPVLGNMKLAQCVVF